MSKILFIFIAKQATLTRRSTLLSVPLQLVFPPYSKDSVSWDFVIWDQGLYSQHFFFIVTYEPAL
jgi:hypothetical protein